MLERIVWARNRLLTVAQAGCAALPALPVGISVCGNERDKSSAMHQRADAMVGQQLKQHRVRNLAVHDDDAFHALVERIDAGLDLGNHAA